MSATIRSNWFWSDWLGDTAVRRLTPTERGVWIDMLALAAAGTPFGYVSDAQGMPLSLKEIGRVVNIRSPRELQKIINSLVEKGAASKDQLGRIYNRRMVREEENRQKKQEFGRAGGAATKQIWQQYQEQLPLSARRSATADPVILSIPLRESSSVVVAAREPQQETEPQSAPATAPPTGARALWPEPAAKRATDWRHGDSIPVSQSLIDHERQRSALRRAAE